MKYFWIVLVVLIAGLFFYYNSDKEQQTIPLMGNTILIAGKEIQIEIADTEEKRIKGLSGRDGLPEDSGLLFVAEKNEVIGIWMKDMKFTIDIAWLDEEKRIIDIKANISPDTYPEIFYPEKDGIKLLSSYVLETNAGFFEKSEIKIGDLAEF